MKNKQGKNENQWKGVVPRISLVERITIKKEEREGREREGREKGSMHA
jgi:hypothetical protein